MATMSLKKYVVVGFVTKQDAQVAFNAALARFGRKSIPSSNLSRCEGNLVYFLPNNSAERTRIESFLLSQQGSQPKGCYCTV